MPLHGQAFSSSLNTVAILAPGLIGGSLALALARHGQWKIHIWAQTEASLQEAEIRLQPAKASLQFEEVIPGAKVVVLCTPVSAMGKLARQIQPFLDEDAVVTDVGSVKTVVMCELTLIFGERFVGGHPMAGSEHSGLEAARWDLFLDAPCVLTPLDSARDPAAAARLEAVHALWAAAGARTFEMTPQKHDTAVAFMSHLPHIAAAALVNSVCSQDISLQEISGGGYRDTTRVAQGSPDLWVDILLENRSPVLKALSEYGHQLRALARLLETSDAAGLRGFLEEASVARTLLKNRG